LDAGRAAGGGHARRACRARRRRRPQRAGGDRRRRHCALSRDTRRSFEGSLVSPGLLIAAPRSGSGKTTITLAVMRALNRRGLAVQGAKCGPDYIDPAFHAAATGRPSFNLDSFAMPPALLDELAAGHAAADLVIAE